MRFLKKLITPVLATVLLLAGVAAADVGFGGDILVDLVEGNTEEPQEESFEWNEAGGDGLLWRYDPDTQTFVWGWGCDVTPESCFELALGETVDDPEGDEPEGEDPEGEDPEGEDPEGEDSETEIDDAVNHGDLVSGIAHQVKDVGYGEAKNRGQVISDLAKATKDLFKDDDADDDEGDDLDDDGEEEEIDDLDDDLDDEDGEEDDDEDGDGPPDHAKDKGNKKNK